VDSGYSSAAIRERVYTYTENNKTVGGLLLYTAQSGGDGTLGGLIGLVPHFERILKSALRNVDACSNDPICIEEELVMLASLFLKLLVNTEILYLIDSCY
jgi:hypothetical protein